jgi:hypothetical protein
MKIHNQFPFARSGRGRALLIVLLTLAPPNKVTPLLGFSSFFPYYVQYSAKRLAAGLNGSSSRYHIEVKCEYPGVS